MKRIKVSEILANAGRPLTVTTVENYYRQELVEAGYKIETSQQLYDLLASDPAIVETRDEGGNYLYATEKALKPGQHFGLDGMGWPPATLVRDMDGRYFVERPLDGSRREVDATEADRLMTPDE